MPTLALLFLLVAPGAAKETFKEVSLSHGGRTRTALIGSPRGKTRGILLLLRGRQGTESFRTTTRRELEGLARKDGFVVAYPEPVGNIFNDGRGVASFLSQAERVDDSGFLWALAGRLARESGVKDGPVYAVGFGAGAFMVQRLVCENDGRLKGAVSVAGTLSRLLARSCAKARPVPVMLAAGDADPFNDWKNGLVHIAGIEQGHMLSPERTLALWGKTFECGAPKQRPLPDTDPEDGTRTLLTERRGCAGGARLRLYTVRGGGFGWPGGEPVDLEAVMGPPGRDFNASQAAWDFLRGR